MTDKMRLIEIAKVLIGIDPEDFTKAERHILLHLIRHDIVLLKDGGYSLNQKPPESYIDVHITNLDLVK